MIFQHFNLMDSRTIFDNVAFPLKGSGLSKDEVAHKVAELLDLVGLEKRRQIIIQVNYLEVKNNVSRLRVP